MALEALIAQRIAQAARARESLTTITAPKYSGADASLLEGRRLENEQRALGNQADAQALADAEAGVPEPIARLVSDNLIPAAEQMPTNIPGMGGVAGIANRFAQDKRRGTVDALVGALGAKGGAKLLAKLSMYTALFNGNNRDALARLKLGADLADGSLGRPPAAPRAAGGGVAGGGAGGVDISGDIGLINGADSLDAILGADLPNMGDPRVRGAYNAKVKVLGAKGVAGRAAGTNEDRDRDFEYRKTRDLKLDYDKQEARRNGDFAKWASIVGEQIRNIDKEIARLEVYETDFNGKVTRKIEGSTAYYNKLLQDRQDKVKELEAVKGEFSAPPPVPGASPPASGRYQWIGGESGTEIVMTTTPNAPPGFKPYTPGGGAGATKTEAYPVDISNPAIGTPKRVDVSNPAIGEPKRTVEQMSDADLLAAYLRTKDPALKAERDRRVGK